MSFNQSLSLFDEEGNRKYLNTKERKKFLECIPKFNTQKRLFCLTLFQTGCRIT